MNLLETVKTILTNGLSKGLISPDEAEFVLQTLHGFLSSHPGYKPKTSRERVAMPSPDEDQLWTLIQPILDRAQGMDRYTHPTKGA